MDLEELVRLRQTLENDISNLLCEFTNKTGLSVYDISFYTIQGIGEGVLTDYSEENTYETKVKGYKVYAEVRL